MDEGCTDSEKRSLSCGVHVRTYWGKGFRQMGLSSRCPTFLMGLPSRTWSSQQPLGQAHAVSSHAATRVGGMGLHNGPCRPVPAACPAEKSTASHVVTTMGLDAGPSGGRGRHVCACTHVCALLHTHAHVCRWAHVCMRVLCVCTCWQPEFKANTYPSAPGRWDNEAFCRLV